jgi:hypothetical protein
LIAVALSSVRATAKPLPIIPLDEGTEWIYSARVRWTVINSNHERGAAIQWRTRVVKSFKTDTAMAAVISGFPTDLAWYEPGEEPGYSVIIETESGLFETSAGREQEAEDLAKKAAGGAQVGEQLLRLPVRAGDCLDRDNSGRTDNRYCWFVEGRVKSARGYAWELTYQTNPDTTTFHIVPGVGVTRFSYDHHGIVASADVQLTGFHAPVRGRSQHPSRTLCSTARLSRLSEQRERQALKHSDRVNLWTRTNS